MKKRKKQEKKTYPAVDNKASKITFKLVASGEWDWNKDFIKPEFSDPAFIEELVDHYGQYEKFGDAFFKWLSNRFNIMGSVVDDVTIQEMDVSEEVQELYASIRTEKMSVEKKKKEEALKEAEAKAARLKKELGR